MKVSTLKVENGVAVESDIKTIDQSTLTGDCWPVQWSGLQACESCEYKGTKECGGGATLKKLKRKK